jgi:hypothetical protein
VDKAIRIGVHYMDKSNVIELKKLGAIDGVMELLRASATQIIVTAIE